MYEEEVDKMTYNEEISLNQLLHRIENCVPGELDPICNALQNRYSELFPDWEVVFLSMPGGSPEKRREQGRRLIDFIQKNYLDT